MNNMSEQSERDREQDEMIRRNAESIRRNEEAILRQTRALEQIRDHYFPKRTLWSQLCGLFLKAVGAVTVAAGILEAADWYLNTRQTDSMAEQCADVAERLFAKENDAAGALKFLEKAVELDSGTLEYRIRLEYVKAMVAIRDLFDLGRPLTADERRRVDDILTESVFLQEAKPDDAMPHVLASQAYALRGEREAARNELNRALALEPENVQVQISACSLDYDAGDMSAAQRHLAEAERLDPEFPLVPYWKSTFALTVEQAPETALRHVDRLLERTPRFALAHVLKGWVLSTGPNADFPAARASCSQALVFRPDLTWAMVLTADTYEREGDLAMARLWLDHALRQNDKCMAALTARARLNGKSGDWKSSVADLTTAIALAPLRADLYRLRAEARSSAGDAKGAATDRKVAVTLDGGKGKEKNSTLPPLTTNWPGNALRTPTTTVSSENSES